jgi:hypothetical protein
MSSALAQYDAMRQQVAACARIDEAAQLRDKAMALRLYAKQSKDRDLQRWVSEIQLRATIKLGELSRKLDASKGGSNPAATLPSGGKRKSQVLDEAGVSTSVANRAEALTGRFDLDDESGLAVEALGISLETAEVYFDECKKADAVPNHKQLDRIIQQKLDDTFGKPASRHRPHKRDEIDTQWIDWTGAIQKLAKLDADLTAMAARLPAALVYPTLCETRAALPLLRRWIEIMERKHGQETEQRCADPNTRHDRPGAPPGGQT